MSGRVLQGYFCIERFRGQRGGAGSGGFWADKAPRPGLMASHSARRGAAQAKTGAKQLGVPRPDLLPAAMSGSTAQAKPATNSAWPGAPRPELLPGMGKPRVSARAAQLQGQAGVVSSPISEDRLRLIGPGKPLEPGIREHMESFFDADFSGVRVHEGPAAQAMGALAFTLGETLYFAPGLYDPSTREGVELLGHELAHVVQQRDGRVSNPHGSGVAIVQDPALEAEADVMGRRAADAMWAKGGVGQLQSLVRVSVRATRASFPRTVQRSSNATADHTLRALSLISLHLNLKDGNSHETQCAVVCTSTKRYFLVANNQDDVTQSWASSGNDIGRLLKLRGDVLLDDAMSRSLFSSPNSGSKEEIFNAVRPLLNGSEGGQVKYKRSSDLRTLTLNGNTINLNSSDSTTILVVGTHGLRKINGLAHAEQKLVAALDVLRRSGAYIQSVWVAGCKRCCNLCEAKLSAFKQNTHDYDFEYVDDVLTSAQGSQRTVSYDN